MSSDPSKSQIALAVLADDEPAGPAPCRDLAGLQVGQGVSPEGDRSAAILDMQPGIAPSAPTSTEAVRNLWEKDPKKFVSQVVHLCGGKMKTWLKKRGLLDVDIEDIMQAVWTELIEMRPSMEHVIDIEAYLFRVWKNVTFDWMNRNRPVQERLTSPEDFETHEGAAHDAEREVNAIKKMLEILQTMDPDLARPVTLCDLQGWPVKVVAHRLGLSVRTVERRLAEGRARLTVLMQRARNEGRL